MYCTTQISKSMHTVAPPLGLCILSLSVSFNFGEKRSTRSIPLFHRVPHCPGFAEASAPMTRSRPRKRRLSRMDAAVDAMAPFGFPESKVKRHVAELLKVYGGDEAWPFIEECAYRELLESLLRDNVGDDQSHNAKYKSTEDETAAGTSSGDSDRKQDERPEHSDPADTAESFSTVAEPSRPKHANSSSLILASHLEAPSSSSVHDVLPVEGRRDVWKDVLQNHPSQNINMAATVESKSSSDCGAKVTSRKPTLASSNILPTRKRLPCYGWIDSDEDNPAEFILLEPQREGLQASTTLVRELPKRGSFKITPPQEQPKRVSFEATTPWEQHKRVNLETTTPREVPKRVSFKITSPQERPKRVSFETTTPWEQPKRMNLETSMPGELPKRVSFKITPPQERPKIVNFETVSRRRRSRWDEKPDDS